jgi:phosphoglycolate phosphatase-like HAD superfamily hydrolase
LATSNSRWSVTIPDLPLRTHWPPIRTPGLTDRQIALQTFVFLGLDPAPAEVDRLVARYEALLPSSLPRKQGRVLDNVREILGHLRAHRPDVRSYLLTGNTPGGARAKLAHYELLEFFPEGAFCIDAGPRAGIAERALVLARARGPVDPAALFVVGDTPHDIECARAIGARTIAVATGGYALDELTPHEPWRAFEALPPPEVFVRLIDEPAGGVPAGPGRAASGDRVG